MATRELRVTITGDSAAFERAMARSERASAKAATGMEAAGKRMQAVGSSMSRAGRTLSRNVTLPIVAVGAASAKLAIDFEKSMRNVNSIAGLPEKQFQKLNKQVLSMAGDVAQAPKTLAEGLYDLVSSGFDATESMKVLHASAKAATAGLTTTEVSTKAIAAALNAYHRPAKDAAQVSDDLFETVNRGVVSFEELAGSIGYVLPAAATMGINIKEVGAAISTLTKEGQSGETAITNINQAITAFIKPSKVMNETLKELGYQSGEQIINQKGFQGALEEVTKAAHGSKQEIGAMFGNVRAMRAVFGLTGKSAKSAREDVVAFNKDAGSTAKVFKEQSKSLSFQWSKLRAELEVIAIKIGNKLIPLMRDGLEVVKDIGHWFSSLSPSTQDTILKVGGLIAVLGPVLSITGRIVSGWGKLFTLIGKIGKGLGVFNTIPTTVPTPVGGGTSKGGGGTSFIPLAAKATVLGAAAYGAGKLGEGSLQTRVNRAGKKRYLPSVPVLGPLTGAEEFGELFGLGGGSNGPSLGDKVDLQQWQKKLNFKLTEGQLKRLREAFRNTMVDIKTSASSGLGTINQLLTKGFAQTNREWIKGTAPWRAHTAQAMQAAVISIEQGMALGTISTKRGQKEINRLLREIKIVKGDDPFGVAEGAANSFKKAHRITASGTRQWIQDLEALPKQSRGKAVDSINGMLQAWAQGHPKLEKQVDGLTTNIVRKFGATNKQLREGVKKGATGPVAEAFREAALGVGGALQNIGVNTNTMLKALGLNSMVEFQAVVLGPARTKPLTGGAAKERHNHGGEFATGGFVDRPMYMVGEEAPSHPEWVIATNPAYRKNNISYWAQAGRDLGVPGFAKGGTSTSPGSVKVRGPQSTGSVGHGALEIAGRGLNQWLSKHLEPPRVLAMLRAGEAITSKGFPYVYGGGHGSFGIQPVDCSGLVSYVLHAGGFLSSPMSVQQGSGLYTLGEAGPGQFFTWGVRGTSGANAHTMISVKAPGGGWKYFESGGSGGGAHETSGWDGSFQFRHMPGYAKGGKAMPKAAREAVARYGQEVFNPRSPHFIGWGYAKGGKVTGRATWFNGGATAGGSNTSQPGLALNLNPGSDSGWNNDTTQGWMDASRAGHPIFARVTIGGKSANLPITDLGPAGWTGNAIDVTEGGVRKLGFTTSNFPSGTTGTAVILGGGAAGAGKPSGPTKSELSAVKVGGGTAVELPGLTNSPLSRSARALPKQFQSLLKSPGIKYSQKVGVGELALTDARDTADLGDDLAAYKFLEDLYVTYKKRTQKEIKKVQRELQKRVSPARRKKLEAELDRLLSGLGEVESNLGSVRSERSEALHPEGTGGNGLERLAEGFNNFLESNPFEEIFAKAMEEMQIAAEKPWKDSEVALALAELTESTGDDLAALETQRNIANEKLGAAKFFGNSEEVITWAHTLKGLEDSIKSLTEGGSVGQMAEEMKSLREAIEQQTKFAESATATNSATAWKALADILSGNLGPRANHAAQLAGNGSVGTV